MKVKDNYIRDQKINKRQQDNPAGYLTTGTSESACCMY